jgi:carbon-monoxide dehydrogenase large subunit
MDDVLVMHGDTAVVQYGIGTFGSRGTAVGGTALYYALQDLKAKIKKFGAMLLESEDVSFGGGQCTDKATGKSVSFAKWRWPPIAPKSCRRTRSPAWWRRISGSRRTSPSPSARTSWSRRWTATPATSHPRYVCVDDCGNIINPLIVDGQVHGGVAQGLGQALWEQAVYDDNGQLITGELTWTTPCRAHMMPWIESSHTETPSPVNPLGVKGVGEAGTIGCSPAVVNSVVDALSSPWACGTSTCR